MDLLKRFKGYVNQNDLFRRGDKLLLAVSGGVDSVVLCELCEQAGYDFSIAHCNFQLRGEESERDEKFVRTLGKKYGVEVVVKKFDTERYATESKKGIQEAARDLRYEWFAELIDQNSKFILTAHHADDNIETVLMNFCRGTGLHGLEGIPNRSGYLRRPLLGFWKHELIEFAKENDLRFVEDSSNQTLKYTRNLFRNEILPLISKAYPEVKSNLRDNIDRFRGVTRLYQTLVSDLKKKLCKRKDHEIHIPIKQLLSYQNRALIFEIISDYGFTERQVDEVIRLAESESGKIIQSPGSNYRVIKFRNWFIISPGKPNHAETILIDESTKEMEMANGRLKFETVDRTSGFGPPNSASIACLDSKDITFPLILRKWKQGDYFYPLGMRKKKKLARFFIDQKLSKTEREKIWVLEMNKKILWVVGHRIDDRFRITDTTKDILKITLEAR